MKNYSRSIGLIFIEDFIFLVKKNFLTKFQKLASERNFDVSQKFKFLKKKKLFYHFYLSLFEFFDQNNI
jgi:hypothetical protein